MNAVVDITGIRLETERLILRPFQLSDLDDFFEYASVDGVGEMAGWEHHPNKDHSLVILKHFIEEKHVFAVVFKENHKVIGSLGIEKYSAEDKLTEFDNYIGREIGYVLSKAYWGRGLMKEAVDRVISYLFNEKNYDFLLCGHSDINYQSKRVQEECGFLPYRKLMFDTRMGTQVSGILNILINPHKKISFDYSHPETLLIGRIHLSPIKDKDKLEVVEMIKDPLIKKTYMLPDVNNEEEEDRLFNKLKDFTHSDRHYSFGVYLKDKLIGFINDVSIDNDEIEVGYFISSKYWGKGYATEALALMINKLFDLGFKKVKASHFEDNLSSGRVMQKCGMNKNGQIEQIKYRDHLYNCVCYEITNKN